MRITSTDQRRRMCLLGSTRAFGLAVPNMPAGSPGMQKGGVKDPYQVLLIGLDANATVFKSYP